MPGTKIRAAPFVQIPLGVTEDRLVGTVDIEASMKVHLKPQRLRIIVYASGCPRASVYFISAIFGGSCKDGSWI